MKLLVTGAGGFIGGYVLHEALLRGYEVLAMVRGAPLPDWHGKAGLETLTWDLAEPRQPRLDDLGIEAVVHLAAALNGSRAEQEQTTVGGTERLLQAMDRAGIRSLVGISSIAVLDYEARPALSIIDESAPVCQDEARMGHYSALKLRQERLYAAFGAKQGNRCTILRPGLVYDQRHLIAAHAGVIKGGLRLLAAHPGEIPVVEVHALTRAILAAVETDAVNRQIIQLVDDDLPNQLSYLDALRRRRLLDEGGVTLPWWVLAGLARGAHGVLRGLGRGARLPEALLPQAFAARLKPFRFSNEKARHLLNWQPARDFS